MHSTSRWAHAARSAALLTVGLAVVATPTATAWAEVAQTVHYGPCAYHVRSNHTPVQDNPNTDSQVLKYKNASDRVTSPCKAQYDPAGTTWFTAVDCSCAKRVLLGCGLTGCTSQLLGVSPTSHRSNPLMDVFAGAAPSPYAPVGIPNRRIITPPRNKPKQANDEDPKKLGHQRRGWPGGT